MPLALLTLSRLARPQAMLLPNIVLYLCIYIYYLIERYSLLSVYLQKEGILSCPHQNEYLICHQQTSHKGFQSLKCKI